MQQVPTSVSSENMRVSREGVEICFLALIVGQLLSLSLAGLSSLVERFGYSARTTLFVRVSL